MKGQCKKCKELAAELLATQELVKQLRDELVTAAGMLGLSQALGVGYGGEVQDEDLQKAATRALKASKAVIIRKEEANE